METDNEETQLWSLGSFFGVAQFPLFPAGLGIRGDLHLLSGEFSGMPVFIGPNLSGGYHIDDNQSVAKQIKVIKPISRNQTPLTLDKQKGDCYWGKRSWCTLELIYNVFFF